MQAVLNIYKKLGLDCGKYIVAGCAKYNVSHVKVAEKALSGKIRTKINRHKEIWKITNMRKKVFLKKLDYVDITTMEVF